MNDLSLHELIALAIKFGQLSLMSVGGAISTTAEMHRFLVEERGWMSHEQFSDAIALAQAAPGPNILFVTLLGWQAATVFGALITTAMIMVPSSLLTLAFYRWKVNNEGTRIVNALRVGLAPVAIGLTAAAGWVIASGNSAGAPAWGLAAAVAVLTARFKINPVWMIALGAVAGTVFA
jgi:chromate transporter